MNLETVDMPERIFTLETAVPRNYIGTLFQSRFTGMDCHIIKAQPVPREKGTFSPEFFILNLFHSNSRGRFTSLPVYVAKLIKKDLPL